jgi:hypothetical protein
MVLPIIIAAVGTVYVVKKVRKRRQRKRALRGRGSPVESDEVFYDYDRTIEPPAYSFTPEKQDHSHRLFHSRGDNGL